MYGIMFRDGTQLDELSDEQRQMAADLAGRGYRLQVRPDQDVRDCPIVILRAIKTFGPGCGSTIDRGDISADIYPDGRCYASIHRQLFGRAGDDWATILEVAFDAADAEIYDRSQQKDRLALATLDGR